MSAYYNEHDPYAAAWLRKDQGYRIGRLRGYGNAIVPQVAEAFIRAYCEVTL